MHEVYKHLWLWALLSFSSFVFPFTFSKLFVLFSLLFFSFLHTECDDEHLGRWLLTPWLVKKAKINIVLVRTTSIRTHTRALAVAQNTFVCSMNNTFLLFQFWKNAKSINVSLLYVIMYFIIYWRQRVSNVLLFWISKIKSLFFCGLREAKQMRENEFR